MFKSEIHRMLDVAGSMAVSAARGDRSVSNDAVATAILAGPIAAELVRKALEKENGDTILRTLLDRP